MEQSQTMLLPNPPSLVTINQLVQPLIVFLEVHLLHLKKFKGIAYLEIKTQSLILSSVAHHLTLPLLTRANLSSFQATVRFKVGYCKVMHRNLDLEVYSAINPKLECLAAPLNLYLEVVASKHHHRLANHYFQEELFQLLKILSFNRFCQLRICSGLAVVEAQTKKRKKVMTMQMTDYFQTIIDEIAE